MAIVIYTYSNPYRLHKEPYWALIKNGFHLCASQTLASGLCDRYKDFFEGKLTTITRFINKLYDQWESPVTEMPPVKPIMYGGQQEHGIRPGTIPVALVAGCGKACELAQAEYESNNEKAQQIKSGLLSMLAESGLAYHINGDQEYCVPGTLNICFEGVSSEALMISAKQFCGISNGSACTSKSYSPSYVLLAMGIPEDQIESSVRISWGHGAKKEDVFDSFEGLINVAKKMK